MGIKCSYFFKAEAFQAIVWVRVHGNDGVVGCDDDDGGGGDVGVDISGHVETA